MLLCREVKAKVLSLCVEQAEICPYVSGSLMEVCATLDKSKSMYFHNTFYHVIFLVQDKKKEFKVEKSVFEQINEGEEGILKYKGSNFVSFIK